MLFFQFKLLIFSNYEFFKLYMRKQQLTTKSFEQNETLFETIFEEA